uniref:Uncharacterized protein n=1 Tax=Panagrolaimus davidi TaxID=227884 RepID=A0A914Q8U1_9BILA
MKIKVRKLEKKTKELEEVIEASNLINAGGAATSSFQPLSIVIEAPMTTQSAPVSPTQNVEFDFGRPSSAPPNLNVQSSVRLKQSIGLSEEKYKYLQQQMLSNGVKMPSLSTVKRFENNIFDSYYRNSRKPDFYNLLQEAVDKYDFSTLPYIRITIGGDKGGKSEKIGFYFNDVLLPLSVKKFIIIHTFVGDETRQLLEEVMKSIDDDVRRLNLHGINTKHGNKEVIITYVGDCKYSCTSLGLQGGSAVSACVNCITKRSDWPTIRSEDIILRTIESIMSCEYEVIDNNATSKSNFSVKNYPLLRNIPVSHFVPPPVHILITLLNQTIIFVRKFAAESQPLETFIIANKVKLHNPSREYEGNQCRKIFSNFRANNSKAIIYNGFRADLFQSGSDCNE